jgi:hypothetical protein
MAVDGDALEVHYRHMLEQLGKQHGWTSSGCATKPWRTPPA